jgi:hypothetical protein
MSLTFSNPISDNEILKLNLSTKWKLSDLPWEVSLRILEKNVETFTTGLLREPNTKPYVKKLKPHPKYLKITNHFKDRIDYIIDSLESSKPNNKWPPAIIDSILNGGYAAKKLAKFLQKHPDLKLCTQLKNVNQWVTHTPITQTFKTPKELEELMGCMLGIKAFKNTYKDEYKITLFNPVTNHIKNKESTLKELQTWALKGATLQGLPLPKDFFKTPTAQEPALLTYAKANPVNLFLATHEELKIFKDEDTFTELLLERPDTFKIIQNQLKLGTKLPSLPINVIQWFLKSKPNAYQDTLKKKGEINKIIEHVDHEDLHVFLKEGLTLHDLTACIVKRPEVQELLVVMVSKNFEEAQQNANKHFKAQALLNRELKTLNRTIH